MPGLIGPTVGNTYKLFYKSSSGREWLITLTAMGPFLDPPPSSVIEDEDGTFRAGDVRYSSLYHLASEHGCTLTDSEMLDESN